MSEVITKNILTELNDRFTIFQFVSQNVEFSTVTAFSNYKNQFIIAVYLEKWQYEQLDLAEIRRDLLEAISKTGLIEFYKLVYDPKLDSAEEKIAGNKKGFFTEIVFDRITIDSLGRQRLKGKVMNQEMDNTMKLTNIEKLLIEKLRNSEDYQLIKEVNGDIIIYDKSPVMNPILILE